MRNLLTLAALLLSLPALADTIRIEPGKDPIRTSSLAWDGVLGKWIAMPASATSGLMVGPADPAQVLHLAARR